MVNPGGLLPYTPATNLLYGLAAALDMLFAEGLIGVRAPRPPGRGDAAPSTWAEIPRAYLVMDSRP